MNTETNVKVSYAKSLIRAIRYFAAGMIDMIICVSYVVALLYLFFKINFFQELKIEVIVGIFLGAATLGKMSLQALMITKLGGTPGKLLCDMHIKSTNTFKNITLIQASVRGILKGVFLHILPSLVFVFCLPMLESNSSLESNLDIIFTIVATMLIFVCARFDQRKQTFYDKIAKTVVIDYKPS